MLDALRRVGKRVVGFHSDEDGMESVQVVMILAIAGLILVVLFAFWDQIKAWVTTAISSVTNRKAG